MLLILTGVIGLIVPYIYTWESNPFGIVFIRIVAGFSFFVIGCFIAKPLMEMRTWALALAGAVAMPIGIITYSVFGNDYSFFAGSFSNMPVSVVNAVAGSVGVVTLCRALELVHPADKVRKALNYIGQNSLIIMLVHPTILLVFTYPLGGFFSSCTGVKGVVMSPVLFAVLVIAEIPFIWIINNYLPWMIGKKRKAG